MWHDMAGEPIKVKGGRDEEYEDKEIHDNRAGTRRHDDGVRVRAGKWPRP